MTLRPIQIWQPARAGGWVRPPVGPLGDHYSASPTLSERYSSRRRLVLVGESVATGYLYAPWYTPAGVLAQLLGHWDVMDLAKTNESLESLVATVEAGLQLEPDVVVMWAGNNWLLRDLGTLSPIHPRSPHRRDLAEMLRRDGLARLRAFVDVELARYAKPRLDTIEARVRAAGARLIVVIPEVNLEDWESCQPVPVLPDGEESAWHDALVAGDAAQMRAIDGAATSTTWRHLGDASDNAEDRIAAYRHETKAASGSLRGVSASPMITDAGQQILRKWAAERDLAVVDVSGIIESTGSRPDRTWFLDYCHHTATGIEAVARAVVERIDDGAQRDVNGPPSELEAVAALGALMHTDHRLVASHDRTPLLAHWLAVAERADPSCVDLVADIVDSRRNNGVIPLSEAQRRNQSRRYPFGFAHGWRPWGLEVDALTVLGASLRQLATREPSCEQAGRVPEPLRPGRALWVDEQLGSEGIGFLRSIWPAVEFAVPVSGDRPVQVDLVARVPDPAKIELSLGDWSTEAAIHRHWTRLQLSIPADASEPGLWALRLDWPRLARGSERWDTTLRSLAADQPTAIHPVFGEVHTVTVRI